MEQIYDTFDVVEVVAEMASGASALVPLAPDLVQQITEGDDEPVFATFVIEGGWSKSKRYWPDETMVSIAEQINNANEPVVGYMGHIKPDEISYSFPDIQMQWLKAVVQPASDRFRILTKAYVLPGTKARDYIKRKLARVISVSGEGSHTPIQGGVKVNEFSLESIDLARPHKSGMKTALVGVTSEMEGGKVKPEEIAALQENELRAHNPNLVTTLEANAKKPLEEKITEIEAQKPDDSAEQLSKVREALGIDESADPLEVIASLLTKTKEAGKSMREKILDDVLGKKFKDEATRNLVRRVLVSEMEDGEEDEAKITEMVNTKIDQDESLRSLVTAGGGKSLSDHKPDEEKKYEPGHSDEYVEVTKGGRR